MISKHIPDQVVGRVLVVDDEQDNLKLLKVFLSNKGFDVRMAESGPEAIAKAKDDIDLILLDIMMPGMSGFETCHLLKADEKTREIPVIFLSALQDAESKATGFEVGGVDYISKPFDRKELLARVFAHITILNQKRQLQQYAEDLERMVEERTRQLVHADRLVTMGTFSAAIIHEINSPLMYISGSAETIRLFWQLAQPAIEELLDNEEAPEVKNLTDMMDPRLDDIFSGVARISSLVSRLKNYNRKDDMLDEDCCLYDIVQDAIQLVHYRAKYSVNIPNDLPQEALIHGNRQKLEQIFVNLINNAIDALPDRKGTIDIKGTCGQDELVVYVHDSGPGIADDLADKIFTPFFTTKSGTGGTGLGLFIVRQIVEEHGGTIALMPFDGQGARFRIALPLAPQK